MHKTCTNTACPGTHVVTHDKIYLHCCSDHTAAGVCQNHEWHTVLTGILTKSIINVEIIDS